MSQLDENGAEILDQTPIVIRVKGRVVSHWDDVRTFIQRELSMAALESGEESFEEANDFDVGDDYDPKSPWEYSADDEADVQLMHAVTKSPPLKTTPVPGGTATSGTPPGPAPAPGSYPNPETKG